MSRDWLTSLWRSSFKGASFWTERDQESGGRRIVKHQFPMRDAPFLEDLGEDLREFELTAYLASDNADADAAALAAACSSRGAGILVMPVQGPVLVRCVSFSRDSTKDRAGYIAFTLKCCREGAAAALVSVALSANLVFVAAETAAAAVATAFAKGLQVGALSTAVGNPAGGAGIAGSFSSIIGAIAGGTVGAPDAFAGIVAGGPVVGDTSTAFSAPSTFAPQPDYVVDAAVGGMQDAVIALEVVRTSEPVDAIVSGLQRDVIQTLFDNVPQMFERASTVATSAVVLIAIARALGDAMPPASALRAFEAIVTERAFERVIVPGTVYATPGRRVMAMNAEQTTRLLRLSALIAYCEAVARIKLADRPAGITLRANVAEYFEAETGDLGAAEIDLVHQIGALRDATIAYLSRVILDLAPVIRLEANLSMPSLFWAWKLYQDPQRSVELVARNRVIHPSFMPAKFEALAR